MWLSRHTRPVSSQASNQPTADSPKLPPFPSSPPLPSNSPTRLSSKSRRSTHTYVRSPRPSPNTCHRHSILTADPCHPSIELDSEPEPEPETLPPRNHHFFVAPITINDHPRPPTAPPTPPSRPPPPLSCLKPTSASAKTTRASTNSHQRSPRSAA